MGFSSNTEVACEFFKRGQHEAGLHAVAFHSLFLDYLRAALNTSARELTQGFYHQHRKAGLT